MPRHDATVTIETWQERILRMRNEHASCPELARLCDRSEDWVRLALRQLGLETSRMKSHRLSRARRTA